jgi:pimeloyl-ACP methyl ester carboxylesterase
VKLDRKRAAVSAGELAFVDLGEGPPVVLLHGFPTSSHLWRNEAVLLSSRMRVVAPDFLGYGESDRPADADLSLVAQAGYVRELLASLGVERFAVAGHDTGGLVAQVLALDGHVDAMVLLDAVSFDQWPIEGIRMLQAATPDQVTAAFVEDVVRLTFDLGMCHPGFLDQADLQAYMEPWLADPAAFFRAARGLDGRGLAGREDELAALDIPALVLWGEEDAFIPLEWADRLGEVLPDSTVALLPGCGHFVNEDAPRTVGPLIFEFLRVRYLRESHRHAEPGPVPVFLERPPGGFSDLELDDGG